MEKINILSCRSNKITTASHTFDIQMKYWYKSNWIKKRTLRRIGDKIEDESTLKDQIEDKSTLKDQGEDKSTMKENLEVQLTPKRDFDSLGIEFNSQDLCSSLREDDLTQFTQSENSEELPR